MNTLPKPLVSRLRRNSYMGAALRVRNIMSAAYWLRQISCLSASPLPEASIAPISYLMTDAASLDDMIDDFAFLDDWEDRYMHVIELGKALAPLTDDERNAVTKVKGCASQVWLVKAQDGDRLIYRGDSDAHIVKGLVAVTLAIYSGRTAEEILSLDAKDIFSKIGLSEHLSMQRSNGLAAMVGRIQRDAEMAVSGV